VNLFAKEFARTHSTLDVLANVAGVMVPDRQITSEGFEKTFAVGYLSAFVLATGLRPLLENATDGRIANVAGVESLVFGAELDFDDLSFSRGYSSFKTAITTVHAKTVLTQILSEREPTRDVRLRAVELARRDRDACQPVMSIQTYDTCIRFVRTARHVAG
jgi:NAD(P)-dependent dehydrogenase (short-subunit alcohol dehydrogenase family)